MVDNRSDLVKVVAAPVVGQRTYRDAREPIVDVADVRQGQAGHVDWPGSYSANETSKPSEYLFDRRFYLTGREFAADRSSLSERKVKHLTAWRLETLNGFGYHSHSAASFKFHDLYIGSVSGLNFDPSSYCNWERKPGHLGI